MIAPTLMAYDIQAQAKIFFIGFLIFVAVCGLLDYKQAKDEDEKRIALTFLFVFGFLIAASSAIVKFIRWWLYEN